MMKALQTQHACQKHTSGVKNSMNAKPLVTLVSSSTGIQKPPVALQDWLEIGRCSRLRDVGA